jgi:hypothetical protein
MSKEEEALLAESNAPLERLAHKDCERARKSFV